MELMTKEISEQAQKQYPLGSDMDQLVVARFHDAQGSWSWYVINQNPDNPDSVFGIVHGTQAQMGIFSLRELQTYEGSSGLQVVRDPCFKSITARELWQRLNTFN